MTVTVQSDARAAMQSHLPASLYLFPATTRESPIVGESAAEPAATLQVHWMKYRPLLKAILKIRLMIRGH